MAYQGKFSQPRNTEEALRLKSELQKRSAEQAQPEPEAPAEPVPQETSTVPAAEAPQTAATAVPAPKAKKSRPAGSAPAKKPRKKKKKANRNITIIFYTVYFVMIAAFFAGMFFLNNWLNNWLVNYEASQPTTRCQEIFTDYFENPDWAALYTMAGLTDTAYEGADAYAAYMTQKVNGQEITYVETSAGLSGGHKYLLKLGSETLGYFTLVDNAPGAELPDWQLQEIHLTAAYPNTVRIQTMKDRVVTVNGVELDDSHIIQISTTLAEEYLPGGIHAPTTCIYQVEGLMTQPTVTVSDEAGTASGVIYDEEAGMFIEQTETNTMGDEERNAAQAAAEVYAKYMIEEANYAQLAKYFDSSSKIYRTITSMTLWMQGHDGYEFANQEVTEYCRYADRYFSARVSLSLNVTRRNGTVKEYNVDTTLFFKRSGSKWLVYDMTNVDVQAPIAEVRLTFKLGDNVVFTNMFQNDTTTFKAPTVTAPEGKVFDGWYRLDTNPDGTTQYTLVFSPAEDGTVTLSAGTLLEPMTLHALFTDAK